MHGALGGRQSGEEAYMNEWRNTGYGGRSLLLAAAALLLIAVLAAPAAALPEYWRAEPPANGSITLKLVYVVVAANSTPAGRIKQVDVRNVTMPFSLNLGTSEGGGGPFVLREVWGDGYSAEARFGIDEKNPATQDVWLIFNPPESTDGKTLTLVLENSGAELDRMAVPYCGDGTCMKGESVVSCVPDCGRFLRLSRQQASKAVQFLAGGILLALLALSVFFVAKRMDEP